MSHALTLADSRQLMRITQRLCRAPQADSLLGDQGLAHDLMRLFHADFIGTTRWNSRQRAFDDAVCVGRDAEMARQYALHFQFEDPISPKARHRRQPSLIHSVVPRRELERTSYYQDFLRPFRTVDGIDLYLYQGARNVGDLRIWRGPSRRPLGEREVALLTLLRPYLVTAMLDIARTSTSAEGQLVQGVEDGAWPRFTHAASRGMQPANVAAERLLDRLPAVAEQQLRARVERAVRAGRPTIWNQYTLSVTHDGGAALIRFVPGESVTGQSRDLERAYGLTPREADVCKLLAEGRTDDQIARELHLSYWTVRTHLRKAFLKFDVSNRGELARVLMFGGRSSSTA